MREAKQPWRGAEWLIVIGGGLFIFILALSAAWEADIRWLHFFQAWMYIAAIWLSLRKSRWGYFVGIAAAGTWDYMSVFVNTFFMSGLHHLASWIRTGHLSRPDQLIAIPAWGSNLILIIGCTWGYLRLRDKHRSDLLRFAAASAMTTIFSSLRQPWRFSSRSTCRKFPGCSIPVGQSGKPQLIWSLAPAGGAIG